MKTSAMRNRILQHACLLPLIQIYRRTMYNRWTEQRLCYGSIDTTLALTASPAGRVLRQPQQRQQHRVQTDAAERRKKNAPWRQQAVCPSVRLDRGQPAPVRRTELRAWWGYNSLSTRIISHHRTVAATLADLQWSRDAVRSCPAGDLPGLRQRRPRSAARNTSS